MFNEVLKKELINKYGEYLVNEEERLESENGILGYERFMNRICKDRENKTISEGTARSLFKETIPVFSKAIKAFVEKADRGGAGRSHTIVPLVKKLTAEQVSYIATKTILIESMEKYNNINLPTIGKNIGKAIEEQLRFESFFNTLSKKEKNKALNGLDRRIGILYKKRYLISYEKRAIEEGLIENWEKWDDNKCVRIGTKLIELFIRSTQLGKLMVLNKDGKTIYTFSLDPEVVSYIDFNDEELANMAFINRPMVIPPKEWDAPIGGGYYTALSRPIPFVRMPVKECQRLYGEVDMPKVYNAVNSIQNTAWQINRKVFDVVQNVINWKNIPSGLDIPPKEASEPPIRNPECDTNEEAQKAWRASMVRYYQDENRRKGKRLSINAVFNLANTYKDYDRIYFPYNIDFRGRIYPLTTLSPQGSDFQKGLLQFAEGKELGEDGAMWLAFQGANCYGLDKAPIQKRLEWVYSNSDLIQRIAKDPLNCLEWTTTDSPWEFLAFCFEWSEYLEKGSSFKSHLPIAFDGSCSGIQHFSAMLRDEIGGKAVNLIPDEEVHDIYGIVANKVKEVLKKDALEGTQDTITKAENGDEYIKKGTKSLANEWLEFGVNRYVTKRCVMTLPYGAKEFGFKDQILEDTIYPALQHNILAFSSPSQSARYMAHLIWEAVHEVVVKAMEAMEWLQESSALLTKDKDINGNSVPTYWVTPAGFPVWQKYSKDTITHVSTFLSGELKIYNMYNKEPKSVGDGDRIITHVSKPSSQLDVRKQRQGIAPNFVHSMDASHLMLTINKCHDEYGINSFAVIHDSYATHASDSSTLFKAVRDVFVDTYQQNDVLQNIHDQIENMLSSKYVEELPPIPKKGNLDLDVVRESMYAFA